MSVGHTVDHVGRRQHDQVHIFVRVDATSRHPEPQLIIVSGKRKGHAEGQGLGAGFAPPGDHPRQRPRGCHRIEGVAFDFSHQRGMQCGRHGNGIAVDAEIKGGNDRDLDVAEPEARSDRHRREQMRRVEQADVELVPHIRPRDLPHERHIEPQLGGKSLVDRHDQGRGINQRDEADMQRCGHFRSSDAVRIDWAISPIFFFSRIAVERIRT